MANIRAKSLSKKSVNLADAGKSREELADAANIRNAKYVRNLFGKLNI